MRCFGRPTLTGHRLPVECVVGRFIGGESVADIARDYRILSSQVECAIRAAMHPRYAAFERAARKRMSVYAKSPKAWWKQEQS